MRKSRFTEQEIVGAVKLCPGQGAVTKYGVSEKTLYTWRKKYAGLAPSELQRLKQLENENQKLKGLVADLSLDKQILQDVLAKKL